MRDLVDRMSSGKKKTTNQEDMQQNTIQATACKKTQNKNDSQHLMETPYQNMQHAYSSSKLL
jgi:hypothetical protein